VPVLPSDTWHLGHKVPRALGGRDEPSNLGPAHRYCNLREAASIGWRASQLKKVAPPSRDWFGQVHPTARGTAGRNEAEAKSPEVVEPSRIF
jgi:hypothetical protein